MPDWNSSVKKRFPANCFPIDWRGSDFRRGSRALRHRTGRRTAQDPFAGNGTRRAVPALHRAGSRRSAHSSGHDIAGRPRRISCPGADTRRRAGRAQRCIRLWRVGLRDCHLEPRVHRSRRGIGPEDSESSTSARLSADTPMPRALQDVIAGCLEKDRAQRRQRVRNAVIELKLAGRSLPRTGEAPRRLPERRAPAPDPAAGGTAPAAQRPAPRVLVARPNVAPYAAQGIATIYGLIFRRRVWVIGGVLLLAAALLAVVLFRQRKPSPAVLKFVRQPTGKYQLSRSRRCTPPYSRVRQARRLHSGRRTASRLHSLAASI
jgi:hypothetical protein